MGRKRLAAVVKLQLPAGAATPAPPVGTALGPHGVQIMEFCKQYNAATQGKSGQIVPVEISIFEDRSFTFKLKTPPTSFLLKQAAGLQKGAADVKRERVGSITQDQLRRIAEEKMQDLNANDVDAAVAMIAGTARSMGIEVG